MTRVTRQALTVKLRCRRPRAELREERWLAVNKSYFSIEMSLATLLDRFAFLVARGIFSHPPKSPTQLYSALHISNPVHGTSKFISTSQIGFAIPNDLFQITQELFYTLLTRNPTLDRETTISSS